MADLTVMQLEKLKSTEKYQKIIVSKGLYIGVAVNGEKTFFVRYTVNGRQRDYRISRLFGRTSNESYISLLDARAKAAEIRALAKDGIDYQERLLANLALSKASEDENLTVNALYETWIGTLKRSDDGEQVKRLFTTKVLPHIGEIKLKDIIENDLRGLLKSVAEGGINRTAEMLLSLLKQMFAWGGGRKPYKLYLDNPAINLKSTDVTQDGYVTVERDRYLSDAEIIELAGKLPEAGLLKSTNVLIWICLSCCTRIGETLMARWADINFETGVWHIPEANTKGRAGAHMIYLSEFAISQFKELKQFQLPSEWCFPNKENTSYVCIKSPTKQITDRQLGFKDRKVMSKRTSLCHSLELTGGAWTPHDLRRTGATLMQTLDVDQHIIERVLNHAEQNRMIRTYQQFDYSPKLRDAWARLGAKIESLVNIDTPLVKLQPQQ